MIKAYIGSIELFKQNKERTVELNLPADKTALVRAFEEAEIQGAEDCEIIDVESDSNVIQKLFHSLEFEKTGIHEMNLFAQKLAALDETLLERFKAAVIIYEPDNISDAVNLSANLGTVNVLPEIRNSEELGNHLVDIGAYKFDDDALPFIDYEKVGADYLAEHDKAELSQMGFIEDYGKGFLDVKIYDGKNLPDDYRLGMGITCQEEQAQANEQSM